MKQLSLFEDFGNDEKKAINVASVPQRSPFRYPGGKTWLVPTIRKWFRQDLRGELLIEPFTGGGTVSLTAAFEDMVDQVLMIELDSEVAAVWQTILCNDYKWLVDEIVHFDLTQENVVAVIEKNEKTIKELALSTVLKNRVFHGGIISKGSGFLKKGENGKGIKSRWYPITLKRRIEQINKYSTVINFVQGDGFEYIERYKDNKNVYFFIDPPYTVAGKRLYSHYQIEHERLFTLASKIQGHFLMTYDDSEEIKELAAKYNLLWRTIPMRTTHQIEKEEILLSDNFDWLV